MGVSVWATEVRDRAGLRVPATGVVAMERAVACCWREEVTTEPFVPGMATRADVATLARGRLVSGGRPERTRGGLVDLGNTEGVAPSP